MQSWCRVGCDDFREVVWLITMKDVKEKPPRSWFMVYRMVVTFSDMPVKNYKPPCSSDHYNTTCNKTTTGVHREFTKVFFTSHVYRSFMVHVWMECRWCPLKKSAAYSEAVTSTCADVLHRTSPKSCGLLWGSHQHICRCLAPDFAQIVGPSLKQSPAHVQMSCTGLRPNRVAFSEAVTSTCADVLHRTSPKSCGLRWGSHQHMCRCLAPDFAQIGRETWKRTGTHSLSPIIDVWQPVGTIFTKIGVATQLPVMNFDTEIYENLSRLFSHTQMGGWTKGGHGLHTGHSFLICKEMRSYKLNLCYNRKKRS